MTHLIQRTRLLYASDTRTGYALRMLRRHWLAACLLTVVSGIAAIAFCDVYTTMATRGRVHTDVADVPQAPVALVLGTARLHEGRPNLFYTARIEAAAALYHAGKVRGVIVSGDHGRITYNEPGDMKADLVAAGVPADHITLDHAGFRTLDSVVRAKKVFAREQVIIVSQAFHLQRALVIADAHRLKAEGFVAADGPTGAHLKIRGREVLARAAAMADLWLLQRGPRYLGQTEEVRLADRRF